MSLRSHTWPAYRRLLHSTNWPILVGPWRGEVGFEALYWLPWLRAQGLDPKRLIPITRGGAGSWYSAERSVELYALRDPKAVRVENRIQQAQTGMLKQTFVSDFDAAVLKESAAQLGLRRYHVLHPAWMFHDLRPFWDGTRGLEWLWPHVTEIETKDGVTSRMMRKPTVAPLPEGVTLPASFVVARFYLRSTFPHGQSALTTAREAIKRVAMKQSVVLLDSGIHADEHIDVTVLGPNVTRMTDLAPVTPENNLAIQAALIAKSAGFIGTYGGLAQLALRHKKPVVSYYQDWQGTAVAHKHLADALAMQQGVPFLCLRIQELPLIHAAVPALQIA